MQRRGFLGAGAAGALALAGCGGSAGKTKTSGGAPAVGSGLPGAPDDGAVLGFMLGLEQLQADLYTRIQPLLRGGELDLARTLAAQEAQHVARLTASLRRLRRPVPRGRRLHVIPQDRNGALALAYRVENLTASAYLGQVGRMVDAGALGDVLALQSVEGRHAAAIGALLGKTATPDGAFSIPQNMATVDRVLGELSA